MGPMTSRLLAVAALAAVVWTHGGMDARTTPGGALGPVEAVARDRLERHVQAIASDELQGRHALSPGYREAARYVAGVLREAGLVPLGDTEGYLQRVRIRRTKIDRPRVAVRIGGQMFRHGADVIASAAGAARGRVVYVGHGWRVPSRGIDPYAGLDVRGALLLVLPILPPGVTFDELMDLGEGVGQFDPEANARLLGAAGVLRVGAVGEIDRRSRAEESRPPFDRFEVDSLATDRPIPDVTLGERALDLLMQGERESGASLRRRLDARDPGPSFVLERTGPVEIDVPGAITHEDTYNVVAKVEGADPALRDEFVALGAHLDHIGVRSGETGDAINNGADDNGSGVAALLEIARAAAAHQPPRRSLLFIWHTGEEVGGWGARHFVAHPPMPLERMVAYLNLDMVGRSRTSDGPATLSGPDELYVVGPKRVSRDLAATIDAVNASYLGLRLDYRYDEPGDPERMYERSDHYYYAQKGIPVAFFFSGLHDDYHRPSDEAHLIDYEKLQKVARTVLAVAWRLASDPGRPGFDGKVE